MKRLIIIAMALVLALTGCKKKTEALSIVGQWQLSNVETKSVQIGSETVDVYVEFTADNQFNLYQVIGKGRARKYSGTYTLTENILTGKYSDGKSFGATYEVSKEDGALLLKNKDGKELDTYVSATIPQTIISSAY